MEKIECSVLLLFIFAINTVHVYGAEGRLGEKCDDLNTCNSEAFLKCGSDSKCECLSNLIVSKGKCVVPYEGNCSVPENGLCDGSSFIKCNPNGKCGCDDSNEFVWYEKATKSCVILNNGKCTQGDEKQQCVEKAKCVQDVPGIEIYECRCQNGVNNPVNGRCVAYYGERCGYVTSGACKEEDGLTCRGDKCECMAGSGYDEKTESCSLRVGDKCELDGRPCGPLLHCSKGACVCKDGLTDNKNKQCYIPHGEDCSGKPDGWECDPASFQICDEKTKQCACDHADERVYVVEDKTCKIKDSFECFPNDFTGPQCIENANCGQSYPNARYECHCKDSLEVGKDHMCYLKHNATCGDNVKPDCNEEKEHICIGGRCTCADAPAMEVDKKGQCRWKLGYSCKEGGIPCVESTKCSKVTEKCTCDLDQGLVEVSNQCKKMYGTSCSIIEDPTGLCNILDYLACIDGKCQCDASHQQKNSGTGLPCVGAEDALCATNANCNSDKDLICESGKCVPNEARRFNLNLGFILIAILAMLK